MDETRTLIGRTDICSPSLAGPVGIGRSDQPVTPLLMAIGPRIFAVLLPATLPSGCWGDLGDLRPIGHADSVRIGALKDARTAAELLDRQAIQSALAFANRHRALNWSRMPVKHGCTVLLEFRKGGVPIGYLAADPVAFYTNGPEGELTREASPKELEDFMKLLPKGVQPVQPCMRTVAA